MNPLISVSAEDRLLLLCARVALEPAQEQTIHHLAGRDLDWDRVVTRAIRHGLPTLVYHHLQKPDLGVKVPAGAWRMLEEANRLGILLTTLQQIEGGRLLDAWRAAGIEAMPLKGLALRESIFPDPALRLCGDLDFLVRPADVEQAEEILLHLGYRPDEGYAPRDWYRPERIHHLVPYHLPGRRVQVEVHWDLMPPNDGFPIPVEALWQRATAGQVAGRPVKFLAPEDLLIHLSLHACYLLRPFRLLGRYLPVLAGAILGNEQSSEKIECKKQELLLDRWLAPG